MQNELGLRRSCGLLVILAVASFALTTLLGSTAGAQDQVTTQQINTATPTADPATADDTIGNANRPAADNFRCESFLRTVTDDRGALREQYQANEQIVRRFEQCLSGDVLANTIPRRNLPFTGGPSLPAAGLALLSLVAVAIVARLFRR